MDKMREEFEKWAHEAYWSTDKEGCFYRDRYVRELWEAWKGAYPVAYAAGFRAAVGEVEQ